MALQSMGDVIQTSVLHASLGLLTGSLIEAAMPPFTDSEPLPTGALTLLVQIAANGAALYVLARVLRDDDGTYGIPLSFALFQGQPELQLRVGLLGGAIKHLVRADGPQTAAQA